MKQCSRCGSPNLGTGFNCLSCGATPTLVPTSQGAEVRQAPTVTLPREVVEEVMAALAHGRMALDELWKDHGAGELMQMLSWVDATLAKLKEATDGQ